MLFTFFCLLAFIIFPVWSFTLQIRLPPLPLLFKNSYYQSPIKITKKNSKNTIAVYRNNKYNTRLKNYGTNLTESQDIAKEDRGMKSWPYYSHQMWWKQLYITAQYLILRICKKSPTVINKHWSRQYNRQQTDGIQSRCGRNRPNSDRNNQDK